jgi:hypothetical protein
MNNFEALERKYAAILGDEQIVDCISVSYQTKLCKAIATQTRLVIIQDDLNTVRSLVKLQLNNIKRTTTHGLGFKVLYPRMAELKFMFTGLSSAHNRSFVAALPNRVKQPKSGLWPLLALSGGLLVLIVGPLLPPRQSAAEAFFADCKSKLSAAHPESTFTDGKPAPEGNRGVVTIFYTTPESEYELHFTCYRENFDSEARSVFRTAE